MWLRRSLAVCALACAALVIARVALRPSSSAPVADATATPTATATATRTATPTPTADAITGARAKRMRVPILMYHVITKAPAGVANAELWVDKDVFAAEMRALRKAGYTAVTLQQVWEAWAEGGPLPRKPIVLTFDDGYLSHFTHAKPVLRALGWPGVLYLTTRNIGPDGLTVRQLRSLIKAGWEIGSHTLTHPDLTTLDDAALAHELRESRRVLRRRLGVEATVFAYPAGRFDARVQAATKAAGYQNATTVIEGVATRRDDPFALPRVRVNASDTAGSLLARLKALR
jgi:peptidoglycan/xylan/chitin deacetylase (PgdA/CDA1 family)